MPRELRRCCAPKPFSVEECGREFYATVPSKLYCSPTCSNRVHRQNRRALALREAMRRAAQPTTLAPTLAPTTRRPPPPLPPTIEPSSSVLDEALKIKEEQGSSEDILARLGFGVPKIEDL